MPPGPGDGEGGGGSDRLQTGMDDNATAGMGARLILCCCCR